MNKTHAAIAAMLVLAFAAGLSLQPPDSWTMPVGELDPGRDAEIVVTVAEGSGEFYATVHVVDGDSIPYFHFVGQSSNISEAHAMGLVHAMRVRNRTGIQEIKTEVRA